MAGHDKKARARWLAILTKESVNSPEDVFRRCEVLQQIAADRSKHADLLPVVIQSLTVRVSVDCALALRVAAADAVWKLGGRHDLALPFLTWALRDEYWGASYDAAEVLSEMGGVAHRAIPELVWLTNRRIDRGPFYFEKVLETDERDSLLAVLARTLGNCGSGCEYVDETRQGLERLADCQDPEARAAACHAIEQLQT